MIASIPLWVANGLGTELVTAFESAFGFLFSPVGLLLVVAGTLLGLLMGVLPGLGGPVALSLLIPLTFGTDPFVAFTLMAATLGGVNFGGSVTAIVLNTPGTAPNAATLFDGHPMAKQGKAADAIAVSAVASGIGALLGLLLFVLFLPFVAPIALSFWSPEYFWLAVVGLATIAVAARGSMLDDLIAGGVGVMLTFHGISTVTGGVRYTAGGQYLQGGIPLVPVLIGLFAIAQMAHIFSQGTIATAARTGGSRVAGSVTVLRRWQQTLRSSAIGWIVGVVPGVGGTVANFVAYLQAKRSASDPSAFGTGAPEGLIASEAANDAKDGGSLIPTLSLGIPGSASTAVLLGAFLLHGLTPGPLLLSEGLDVIVIILLALVGSNVLTSAIGLLAADRLATVTRLPTTLIVPVVLSIGAIGAFAVRGQFADIVVAAAFAVVGYLMLVADVSRVALIIGLVLGEIAEENFHRSLQIADGSYGVFLARPGSIALVVVLLIVLSLPVYDAIRNRETKADTGRDRNRD